MRACVRACVCVCVYVCTVSGDLNLGIYISRNMIVCMCRVARNVYNAVSMLVFDLSDYPPSGHWKFRCRKFSDS